MTYESAILYHNCTYCLCLREPIYLPDVRMSVQHGSHECSAGSGHTADEDQWHVSIVSVDLHVFVGNEFLKENDTYKAL